MILAAWRQWVHQGQWWWLAILVLIVFVDALIGSWVIAKELELLRQVMRG